MKMMSKYLQPSKSNGIQVEQALIRRWWHENHQGRGLLVWEYHVEGHFIDAVWFTNSTKSEEVYGKGISKLNPLLGNEIVLLEAKEKSLSYELIVQALVYRVLAERSGGEIRDVCILAQYSDAKTEFAARTLGLSVDVRPLLNSDSALVMS
jgi:hypothetical protein